MSFPTTGLLDQFNRADGAVGSNWSANPDGLTNPTFNVSSNRLVPSAAGAWMTWNVATYGPDAEVYATIAVLPASTEVILLALRSVNVGTSSIDEYEADVRPSDGRVRIFRTTNDSATLLTTVTTAAWSAGDGFGLEAVGSTITVYHRVSGVWSAYASTTDSTYTAAGRLGVYFSGGGALDDFGGGTRVAVSTVTGATATALTVVPATAGFTSRTGATAAALTVLPATAGVRSTAGATATALTVVPATAGVRATAGVSATALTVLPATDGAHTGVGASAASIPIAPATAGVRQTFGADDTSVPFDFSTSAGAAIIAGASATTVSVTASTEGVRVVVGVSATLVVVTPATAGATNHIGASAAAITLSFTTTAMLGQFAASATLISVVATTAGQQDAPTAPVYQGTPESRRALAVIRTRSAEKGWTVIGSDIASGMVPEGLQLAADRSGPTTAGFSIRRDPTLPQPDLSAFAECEVEVGGTVVWGGRVWDTPGQAGDQRSLSVTANGWRGHLDDDVYQRLYVMPDLTRFVDARSLLTTPLSPYHKSAPLVTTGQGLIVLAFPGLYTVGAGEFVTATFDAGASLINRGVVTFTRVGPSDPGDTFYMRLSSNPDPTAGGDDTSAVMTSTGTTLFRTATTPRRYCHLLLYHSGGAGTYGSDDQGVQITACSLFGSTSWESGGASALKPHQVILDARDQAAPLLSSADERVDTSSTFSIPMLTTDGYQSPWEMMSAANAYLGWNLGVDALKRVIFEPRPDAPIYLTGVEAAGADFSDQSVISAETVYNRVIVQGQDAGGSPLNVIRTASSPLLDRLGVTRTKVLAVSAVINSTSAAAIGDVWLAENSRAQFRGSLKVTGMGGITELLTGRPVHPSEVLLKTGQLIRFADLHDPETGGEGRDGVIDSVQYDHDSESVSISIDNTRGRFASLLERIGALQSVIAA